MNSPSYSGSSYRFVPGIRPFYRSLLIPVLLLTIPLLQADIAGQQTGRADSSKEWTFVSTPDFFNVDVGDLTEHPGYKGDKDSNYPGEKNSMTPSWRKTTGKFLDFLKSEQPEFVAVAGDLVMARWHQDAIYEGVFGPKKKNLKSLDLEEEKKRVRNAAAFYFTRWNRFFEERDLKTYPAVGDHELADDYSWKHRVARQTVPTHRDMFSRHFVDPIRNQLYSSPDSGQHKRSAYAVRHRNLLLISVDVFSQSRPTRRPELKIGTAQLNWLKQLLNRARTDDRIDHVIVQGHIPVLFDGYDIDANVSGQLHLKNGEESPFWKLMTSNQVDLYLAGEVHAENVNQEGNRMPLQITHGGLFGFQGDHQISYLVGKVSPDKIRLTLKSVGIQASGKQFFQPGNPYTRLRNRVEITGKPETVGTLTIDKSGSEIAFRNKSGYFKNVTAPGK